MDIHGILKRIDELYSLNRGEEAEALMLRAIETAAVQRDDGSMLQLLNELMGYYRETSQVKNSYMIASQAIKLAHRMGLSGTIPYATTLLNAANAYRAGGALEESLRCYLEVRRIYQEQLEPDDMLAASLENNLSLLYQEMGDFRKAKECLLKALDTVKARAADFEVAVTYTNLASSCMKLGETEEAFTYATLAIQSFEEQGVADAHYGAALSALATYYYAKEDYLTARSTFVRARDIMEKNLGRNDYFYRLEENIHQCDQALKKRMQEAGSQEQEKTGQKKSETVKKKQEPVKDRSLEADSREEGTGETNRKGLALCRAYYEAYGKAMIEEQFPDYAKRIAVGLVGEGSDCFGYDDAQSQDHDWGPDFCMWVTEETYAQIGRALQQAYDLLPTEFEGFRRTVTPQGKGRRGVMTISSFYKRLLQTDKWEEIDWHSVSDASLAAAVNGEVFRDDEGIFTAFRMKLLGGYPENIRFLKLAESAARFSQAGQYNFGRVCARGDILTAQILLADAMREAMKLKHYLENVYPPHDKWLYTSLKRLPGADNTTKLLGQLQTAAGSFWTNPVKENQKACEDILEQMGTILAKELYEGNLISDIDPYLDAHTEELISKATLAVASNEELVEKIAKLEFTAFDKVKNEGGRASCQNDWATFSIMRKSQYLTWNRSMLLQYYYDFYREYHRGHNLIEEKYGRMMESTAPEEYAKIKDYFPILTPEKKAIIEQIVAMQVNWMEEFAAKYPCLAENARSVHTSDDSLYNTSYETYLRGEISTYSDKMLELYGRYVVDYAQTGRNLTFDIMTNSVHLYGYEGLDAAESFLAK